MYMYTPICKHKFAYKLEALTWCARVVIGNRDESEHRRNNRWQSIIENEYIVYKRKCT